MRQTVLPGADLSVSRFAFGTASLFNVGTAKQRADLLAAAYDNGFTHFDTAPYYGFGLAERDLRALLKTRRDVTVATKVGLYSPGGEAQPAPIVFARKAAGKILPALSRPSVDWSVARARAALSGSLKRLGRERIDLYLLHEPDAALLAADEWLRWLESERDRVARFGVAVDSSRLGGFLATNSPLAPIVQTIDSLAEREADALLRCGRPLQITYGYVRAAVREGRADVAAILEAALRRNATGCVIVSTGKRERLAQYSRIAEGADKATALDPAV
jgi:aryl-alcohol dehydrogenase-like predicted oxidoreductase